VSPGREEVVKTAGEPVKIVICLFSLGNLARPGHPVTALKIE
jgi:hypothetical protein